MLASLLPHAVSIRCNVARGRTFLQVCFLGTEIFSPFSRFLMLMEWVVNQIYLTVLSIPNNTIYM